MVFVPLPVETLASWHEVAIQQVRKLGAALADGAGGGGGYKTPLPATLRPVDEGQCFPVHQ